MTLYDELKAAGIPTDHHESDLYVPDLALVWEILARYPIELSNARRFVYQAPPHKDTIWIDIPFAYIPWWEARSR